MASFKEIALPLAARGIPVIPLHPKSKIALLSDWPVQASIDSKTIEEWSTRFPNANCASVALGQLSGVWFFEIDDPTVLDRLELETGRTLPETFRVESRPGREHFYFQQSESSLRMGNLAQAFVHHGDFSCRVDKQYVVSPGSVHPVTGVPYRVVADVPIVQAPEWFITWLLEQKIQKKAVLTLTVGEGEIPSGQRNATLASIAGKFRANGAGYEVILAHLTEVNQTRCNPPLPQKDLETIAGSISRYKAGSADPIFLGGKPLTDAPLPIEIKITEATESPLVIPVPYPKFPRYIMERTSIYKGLVKPWCDVNSRYPEFMFMPAITILMNALSGRIKVKYKGYPLSNFMVLVGRRGETMKSSCVADAIEYFRHAGIADQGLTGAAKGVENKSIIWTVGSAQGLGIEMTKSGNRNAILYYDEFSNLTGKAGIEGSTLISDLLTLYEGRKFQNVVKSRKDCYTVENYCASLIACCTDKNFLSEWAKLSTSSTGLDDRFFFLFQPEKFVTRTPQVVVDTSEAARIDTRGLFDMALRNQEYSFTDFGALQKFGEETDNRSEIRAEKFAVAFAVDMGREEIDDECISYGIDLERYNLAVKKYLAPFEGLTREGSIQMDFLSHLRRATGNRLTREEVHKLMHPERLGTTLWSNCYNGLLRNKWIAESGSGVKNDPVVVTLLRDFSEDED